MGARPAVARLVVALVCAVVLAGCQSEPEPRFADPPPSPSESDSTSASPSPSESETVERLSPEDTVRAWVEAYNVALRTGDGSEAYALSTDDCEPCEEFVGSVVETHDDGGSYSGGEWAIASVRRDPKFRSNSRVLAGIRMGEGSLIPTEGADRVEFAAVNEIRFFELAEADGIFRVSSHGVLS